MNDIEIQELINEPESEYLDFKEKVHESNLELIQDILCLANANCKSDRYIVYGVAGNGDIVNVSDDEIKKFDTNHVVNILRQGAHLNKSLYNYVTVNLGYISGKKVLVLRIKNVPLKPFFLQKDYKEETKKNKTGIKLLRAGVVYTRNGDGNTPIDFSASDDEIELMFRERFGIDKTPGDRALIYLKDYENWDISTDEIIIFYKKSPEYKIIQRDDYNDCDNKESELIRNDFIKYIPDPLWFHPGRVSYLLKYNDIKLLECILLEGIDNFRRVIPYPIGTQYCNFEPYIKNNYELDMCQIIQRKHHYWTKPEDSGVFISYDVLDTIKTLTKFEIREPGESE